MLSSKLRHSTTSDSEVRTHTLASSPSRSQSQSQSQSQKSPKKRQSSTLRSLKDSLKFKGSVNHKKSLSSNSNETLESLQPSKVRSGLTSKGDPVRAKQRLSAQRITLFKYEKVRAMSCSVDLATRRGSESSTSTMTMKSSDTLSDASIQSHSSVRIKPTTLVSSGALEVYQIFTPNLNPKEKTQEMNYLSLGRKDTIVHPILPRLRVSKLGKSGIKFLISFYNPERYWEIEFLPAKEPRVLADAIAEFEAVISKICIYSTTDEQHAEKHKDLDKCAKDKTITNVVYGANMSPAEKSLVEESSDEEEDDLSYLLTDEKEVISDTFSQKSLLRPSSQQTSDKIINDAFKKAIQNVKPSHTQRNHDSERFHDFMRSARRFSSYQPISQPSVEIAPKSSKRFSSVPAAIDNDLLLSFKN